MIEDDIVWPTEPPNTRYKVFEKLRLEKGERLFSMTVHLLVLASDVIRETFRSPMLTGNSFCPTCTVRLCGRSLIRNITLVTKDPVYRTHLLLIVTSSSVTDNQSTILILRSYLTNGYMHQGRVSSLTRRLYSRWSSLPIPRPIKDRSMCLIHELFRRPFGLLHSRLCSREKTREELNPGKRSTDAYK